MRKSRRWLALVLALALTTLLGGAALASAGGSSDPLVTLSYLNQTVIPDILSKVESSTKTKQADLEKKFADQISAGGGSGGTTASGGAEYTLLTLTTGQTVHLDVGCEVLLRVGSASVNANTSPALIDLSDGNTINSGAGLTKNHLYMATIPDRTLTPAAADTKVLIRGGYTVS